MKQKLALLLALCASIACAQNSVTVHVGTKTWSFTLPVGIASLTCDKTTLNAGDTSTCTITLDSPAPPGGYVISPYSADSPAVLNPATVLAVPPNGTTITFTVSRPAPTAKAGGGNPVIAQVIGK